MGFWIDLLVAFLVKFLIELFKELFKAEQEITAEKVEASRKLFLEKVQWRVWFGFNRTALANRAFTLMTNNLSKGSSVRAAMDQLDRKAFALRAEVAVVGIKDQLLSEMA